MSVESSEVRNQVQKEYTHDEMDNELRDETMRLTAALRNRKFWKYSRLYEGLRILLESILFNEDVTMISELKGKIFQILLEEGILKSDQIAFENMEFEFSSSNDASKARDVLEAVNILYKSIFDCFQNTLSSKMDNEFLNFMNFHFHHLRKGYKALFKSLKSLVYSTIKLKHEKRNDQNWPTTKSYPVYAQIITFLMSERYYIEFFMQVLKLKLPNPVNYNGKETTSNEILINIQEKKLYEKIETYFKLNSAMVKRLQVIISTESLPKMLIKRERGTNIMLSCRTITTVPYDFRILFLRNIHRILDAFQNHVITVNTEIAALKRREFYFNHRLHEEYKQEFAKLYKLMEEYFRKTHILFSEIDQRINNTNEIVANHDSAHPEVDFYRYITSLKFNNLLNDLKDLNTHIINMFIRIFRHFQIMFKFDSSLLLLGGFVIKNDMIIRKYLSNHNKYVQMNSSAGLEKFEIRLRHLKAHFDESKKKFEDSFLEKNFYITSFVENSDLLLPQYNVLRTFSELLDKIESLIDHFHHESLSYNLFYESASSDSDYDE